MRFPEHLKQQRDLLIAALATLIVIHPRRALAAAALLLLACLGGVGGYTYSLDHRVFFSSDNPQLLAYEKLHEDYARTDTILMALAPADGNVFSPAFVTLLRDLTDKSWQIPHAQRVESLSNFQHVAVDGDSISTRDLLDAEAAGNPAALAAAREIALAEPFLVNALVNAEGTVAGVRITLNMPGVDQIKEVPEVVGAVRALADEVRRQAPGTGVHLAGQTIANQAFPEASQADFVRVWPWFSLTMMVLLAVLFRSVKAMLVTFFTCQLAVLGGAGFVGYFQPVINDSVIVAPIMILAMAFADGVHLVVNWIQGLHAGQDRRAAMAASLRANMGAMTLTTLLTAVGFLTLHFNDSPPFRVMGYIVAAGVVLALVFTFLITAPLLVLLPGKPPARILSLMQPESRQMDALAGVVIRHRHALLAAMLVLAAGLIALVPRNVVNDDIVKYYTKDTTFRQDMEFVNARLTGTSEINYSLPADGADGIVDPAYLRQLDRYAEWLKTQPDVTQVNSLADIIKRVNQVMHGNDPAYYRIPDSREEIAQYLLQYELSLPYGMDLGYLLRFDRSASRLRVAVGTSSGQRLIALDAAARAWQQEQLPPAMQAPGASLSLMFAHIGERSITGMFGGMLGSLVAASLLVVLLAGALRLGLITFVGNLVPIGMAFGVWSLLNGNIDLGLTLVLGISFSVVIDDTIYFISKYEKLRRAGHDPEQSVRLAFRQVGFALITTSVVLAAGFAWLANSAIQITVNTAVMTTMTIGFALLCDLVLLPVLYLLLDRRQMPVAARTAADAGQAISADS